MVAAQSVELFNQLEIIDHHANDATGFAVTLFRNRVTGAYILSPRSTEFRTWGTAGDAQRDLDGAGKPEIYKKGFAFAQLASMEDYWRHIRTGERWNGTIWAPDTTGKLTAFKNHLDAGGTFYTTGYSLSGHLSTVFTLMHENEITRTYNFNAAGHGYLATDPVNTRNERPGGTTGAALQQMLEAFTQGLSNPASTPELPLLSSDEDPRLTALRSARALAVSRQNSDPNFRPFDSENGLIDSSSQRRGNVYSDPRYAYAVLYTQEQFPTASLAANDFLTLFGVIGAGISALFTGDFTSLGQRLQAAAGSQPVSGGAYDKITQLFGGATHDDYQVIANSQRHSANEVPVFIEDQPDVYGNGGFLPTNNTASIEQQILAGRDPGDFGTSHALVLIIDTLSLAASIQEVVPSLALEDIVRLMAAASNLRGESNYSSGGNATSHPGRNEADSLENLLDAMRKALYAKNDFLTKTAQGTFYTPFNELNDGFGTFSNRTKFYDNLAELKTLGAGKALLLESLVGLNEGVANEPGPNAEVANHKVSSAAAIAAAANSQDARGFAYRYALRELNPFVLIGDALYADYRSSKELDLYNPASAQDRGAITNQWIEDRAEFLRRKLILNVNNLNSDLNKPLNKSADADPRSSSATESFRAENVIYEDRTSGYRMDFGVNGENRRIAFGSDSTDVLQGRSAADRLYGDAGTDYLVGGAGDDRLEGGLGMDLYAFGGSAAQSSSPSRNDGNDTILDPDGKGVIRYTYTDGSGASQSTVIIEASDKLSDTQWQSADGNFTYTKTPNDQGRTDLVVTINGDAGGSLTLKDWREGDFAIRLREARANPQTAANPIFGDREPQDFDPATAGTQEQNDALGNVIVTATVSPNRDDALFGNRPDAAVGPTAAGEKIEAGGGHDQIFSDRPRGEADNGLGNADWVVAGAGQDVIETGAGNDLIEAGPDGVLDGQAGGDVADGGAGDDELYAEAKIALADALRAGNEATPTNLKGDLLSGAAGEDWIIGDRATDLLLGGGGQDLIAGGAGDDTIWGDVDLIAYTRGWQVERSITVEAGRKTYAARVPGATVTDSTTGAADVIYGGTGADWSFAGAGDDFIDAGADDDVSFGEAGADILIGGAGNDVLAGDNPGVIAAADEGGDYLDGGAGNDELFGNGGGDFLIGGTGNDLLQGGTGKDIYVFNRGDGVDTVFDTDADANSPDPSVLVLGEGISRGNIKFRPGSLLVELGPSDPADPNSPRDAIHFEGFDPFNPFATQVLGEIRFADGTSMSYSDILAQGFDIDGTEGNDNDVDAPMLVGTAVTDSIRGFGGNDVLLGDAGADILNAGAGRDILAGGEGADTYLADFEDVIDDASGGDLIDLGLGSAQEVTVSRASIEGRSAVILSRTAEADPARVPQGLTLFGDISAQNVRFAFGGEELSSEAFFNLAFTDSLQLFGTASDDVLRGFGGADRLVGLEGNDQLIGDAGADTLEGEAGDDTLDGGTGADTLIGREGADVYLFGPGSGRDTIADVGDTFSVDALQFSTEVTPETISFARQANGDLKVILNNADEVTIAGHYSDPANRIEEFRFGDGRIITAGELNALPVAPITGSAGDDALSGGPFDDVLIGLVGADTLDGKAGNDSLQGGEGEDTYILDYGMGRDTATDSGANVIALRSGLKPADLSANRRGEDLLVSIRGTDEGLTLKDYSAQPQQWRVRDATGAEAPIEDVIAATEARAREGAAAVREDYVASLKAAFAREFVTQGYSALGNDAFARTSTLPYSASFIAGSQNRTTVFRNVSGEITSTGTETFPLNHWNYTASGRIFRDSAQLQGQTIASNAAFIVGGGGTRFQATANHSEWTGLSWTVTGKGPVNHNTQSTIQPRFGPLDPLTGERVFLGTVETRDEFVFQQNFARGALIPVPPGVPLAIPPASHLFPQVASTLVFEENITQRFVEVIGGAGANTIIGGDVVQAGAGNDTVDSAGFIDGGPGDDTLLNGSLMLGGAGDDRLTATFGANRFLLVAENNGTDAIRDEEGIDVTGFADLYYRSIGVPREVLSLIAGGDEGGPTLDEIIERFGLPPLPRPDDLATIGPVLAANGVPVDTVEFSAGVSLADLSFAWNVGQAALDISWPGGAASIAFPISNSLYGFGIERFSFADGTALSMSELLAFAPPKPVLPILGTADSDLIEGSRFDDFIRGLDGDDSIRAGRGSDVLDGGAGNDALEGGAGGDVYLFGPGAGNDFIFDFDRTPGNVDTVRLGLGIDPQSVALMHDGFGSFVLEVAGSGDTLFLDQAATNFASVIERFEFADGTVWDRATIETLAGSSVGTDTADVLAGTGGDDRILGLGGDDAISAGDGNDYVEGGPGNDALTGGFGDDIYVFNPGDGVDTITDAGGFDKIIFGPGITPEMLSLGLGSLLIRVGDRGEAIHLADFDPSDAASARGIEDFLFADGSFLGYGELIARGFDLFGTADDDVVTGTSVTDRIDGLAGNDTLIGGQGSDTYFFGRGSGRDVIEDLDPEADDSDTVAIGEGVSSSDISVSRNGEFIELSINGTADSLSIRSQPEQGHGIERVEFSNGTVWDAQTLESMAGAGNTAPTVANPIPDELTQEDAFFELSFATVFSDPGDTLGYTASFPDWLTFDAVSRQFSGTPANENVGSYEVNVTATDAGGLAASDTFALTVANVNDAPTLASPISDKTALEDAVFGFTLPQNTFADVDAGDALSFSAAPPGGGALPTWLVFDGVTQTFTGTPTNDDVGTLGIEITATDRAGASATGAFNLTVENMNDAPLLVSPLPDQFGNQNAPFHFAVPDATFTDIDAGDVLTFSAALADGSELPAWLGFDPLSRTFSGTPSEFDVGTYEVRVTATDNARTTAAGTFALSISDAAATFRTYVGTKRADVIRTGFDNDLIEAGKGDDRVASGAGRDLILAGKGDDHVHAGHGNDYLLGGKGRDWLLGEAGNDVLFGQHGDDHLDGGAGNDLLDGGTGRDHLYAGAGNNLLVGGPGGDTLVGGNGHDVFLFNRGDGKATLHLGDAAAAGNTDTLSLGAGITPDDVILRRRGHDLLVKVDESDEGPDHGTLKIVLKDWYDAADHRTVTRLQLIGERIETYDFKALAARYEAATGGRERHWHAGAAMSEALLSVSHSEAIGGALAHQYATHGTLAHVSAPTLQATLADPLFGDAPQPIGDAGGPLLEPSFAAEGEEGTGAGDFVALVSDPGVVNGALLHPPQTSEEVADPPRPGRRGGHKDKGSDDEERWEALIESWFDRARDGAIPLSALLDGDDAMHGGKRRRGHGQHHPTPDEIAASWRRTQALLGAHLSSHDPAALGGGEERTFSTLFSGLGSPHPVLSGDRLSRVSGHPLRRLEGLEEGLSRLGS